MSGTEAGRGSRYAGAAGGDAAARPAVSAHAEEPAPGGELLDLRWSPDEAGYVTRALEPVWAELCASGPRLLGERARHYAVRDPYAGRRAAPVLARQLGCPLTDRQVTAGAGVTGLLHALAGLATAGPLLHLAAHHPDLPLWARQLGACAAPPARSAAEAAELTVAHRPSLVLLERPAVDGGMASVAEVERLARALARARSDGLLVVDESYANYAGPSASTACLLARHGNLVVLRGLAKGYCAGGLRVGFALAGEPVTERLRRLAPPLAVNELGLHAALRLLARGDVFGPLRERTRAVRPRFRAMLRAVGLALAAPAASGPPWLPWVAVEDGARARALLAGRGILAKEICTVPPAPALLRLSVPLSEERERAVYEALRAGGPRSGGPRARGPGAGGARAGAARGREGRAGG
ncbi:aminotransferase class I/II-fold pyridoxal phosphate-dependent enzyme [Streptomyces sp. ODS28]|uniref:aminotransferase class I/II-fold pyridoxal phosphate-dependent enzyme n=1 Tax=Streptomyces sp. ODS28 TaxID=3136688 RepID=UPI0031EFDD04